MFRVHLQLVLLAILSLCVARANAQGTRGQLPDPITGMRLMVYADMLSLSPQQRRASDDLHATYRAGFQQLRETEVDHWIKSLGDGYTRAYIAGKRRLLQQIAARDNQFFDSLTPLLADEQVARLPRVRAMRQRERAMQVDGVWSWQDAQPVDLSQVIGEMALPTDQSAAIDSTLAIYESELTVRFEGFVDAYFRDMDKLFDAWEQAGWTDERRAANASSPEQYEVIQPVSNQNELRLHATMKELVEFNQRTLRSLKSQLPASTFRPLQKFFLIGMNNKVQYFSSFPALLNTTSPYDKVLARDGLTDEQRSLLSTQAAAFQKFIDDTADAMLRKIEAYRETYIGNNDRKAEFEARTELEREIGDQWQVLMKRSREERTAIEAVIGKEPEKPKEEVDLASIDLATVSHWGLLFEYGGLTSASPTPIAELDLRIYARWLNLDDGEQEALRAAHARYMDSYSKVKERVTPPLREAGSALYAGDTVEGYTRENLDRSRALSAAAERDQHAMEEAFFADLATTLNRKPDDDVMPRVRQSRERRWLVAATVGSSLTQEGRRYDGAIDLERLICRIRDFDLGEPAVDQILREYDVAIMPLLSARARAAEAYSELENDLRVEWQEHRAKTGDKHAYLPRTRLEELGMREKKVAAVRACDPISELNQSTVTRLCEVLPLDSAERVRRTFERIAWPSIYDDRSAAGPLLSSALLLRDMTLDQRAKVEQIAADYRPAYDAICDRMKTMVEQKGSWAYDQEHATQEQLQGNMFRMSERQRVLFERHEMNVRAWRQLKSVLTPEQAQAINIDIMPPEGPDENEDFGW